MKYFKSVTLLFAIIFLASCVKYEVIPPPKKELTLPVAFNAIKNGATYEIIKDVDGFYCYPSQKQEILPPPAYSNIIYYSALKSDKKADYIEITLGQLKFDATKGTIPSKEDFKTFFDNDTTPDFKKDGIGGVEITYRDSVGNVFVSDENSGLPQSFSIISHSLASDETGDYMRFTAQFNASLYEYDANQDPVDTVTFQNAIYKGYFKRQNN